MLGDGVLGEWQHDSEHRLEHRLEPGVGQIATQDVRH